MGLTKSNIKFEFYCFFLSNQYDLEACPGSFTGSYPGEIGLALHCREFYRALRGRQSQDFFGFSATPEKTTLPVELQMSC